MSTGAEQVRGKPAWWLVVEQAHAAVVVAAAGLCFVAEKCLDAVGAANSVHLPAATCPLVVVEGYHCLAGGYRFVAAESRFVAAESRFVAEIYHHAAV